MYLPFNFGSSSDLLILICSLRNKSLHWLTINGLGGGRFVGRGGVVITLEISTVGSIVDVETGIVSEVGSGILVGIVGIGEGADPITIGFLDLYLSSINR